MLACFHRTRIDGQTDIRPVHSVGADIQRSNRRMQMHILRLTVPMLLHGTAGDPHHPGRQ